MDSIKIVTEDDVRKLAREQAARPAVVTQRTVERVTGLRARLFLRLCREVAFPSTKIARDIIARTEDVLAYVEARIALRGRPAANDGNPEAIALARVGMRRVAP